MEISAVLYLPAGLNVFIFCLLLSLLIPFFWYSQTMGSIIALIIIQIIIIVVVVITIKGQLG